MSNRSHEQLFKDIDTGKFANRIFPEARKNDAAEYSAIPGMNEQLVHEFVQDITARMFQIIFRDNKSLYVTIGNWVYYIDDSTNEQIISKFKTKNN